MIARGLFFTMLAFSLTLARAHATLVIVLRADNGSIIATESLDSPRYWGTRY